MRHERRFILLTSCLACMALGGWSMLRAQTIFLTADTQGHVGPCQHCPGQSGLGGLARRAALLRQRHADLLLDVGNALFGEESLNSDGNVMVAAYGAMGYDAVNISSRDFRFGKAATLKLLHDPPFVPLSANLLDESTGQPLFKPYFVKQVAGQSVAVIGVTEVPAGLDFLPHLKQQFAGIHIQPPQDALDQWMPKVKAQSGKIILLYYGSSTGLRAVREKFAGAFAAILVGGLRPEELPKTDDVPLVGTEEHGRSLALLTLNANSPAKVESLQITPDIAPDPAMQQLVAKYGPGGNAVAAAPTASSPKSSVKRVTAHQDLPLKGLEGVGITSEQVNAAIDHGAAFLWNYIKTKDLANGTRKLGGEREHELACLALIHAGAVKKFPDFEPALREFLSQRRDYRLLGTYETGLLCMLIESYGNPEFFPVQRQAAQYLVESQGQKGTWTYNTNVSDAPSQASGGDQPLVVLGGPPIEGQSVASITRQTDWKIGQDGDNSCSQFAILGLHSASRCNNKTATDMWQRNLDANIRREAKTGGWGYNEGDGFPYGSMTCAGICAVAVNQFELGNPHPEQDERIERGLAWLDANFSVSDNPKKNTYFYYYLYSLERVGRVLDTEFIGAHEWYPLGAKELVSRQEQDGKWLEKNVTGDDPRVPTSFALLFLTRATPKLHMEIMHGGPGTLVAAIKSPPPSRLYIILDASGSMIDMMGDRSKFDVARDAVKALLDALPDGTQVALRVYGHRKSAIEPGSDEDTKLEMPMGVLDRGKMAAKLASLRACGKTPLALSLQDSISDLGDVSLSKPATLIMLTDGGEDTMPRRNPVKAADELRKHPGITFEIIGFDINQEDWGEQLRAMAEHAVGHYWPAPKPEQLVSLLLSAVLRAPQGFIVSDTDGHEVARGQFGKSLSLPEGRYRVRTSFGAQDFTADFAVATAMTTAVVFDASRVPAVAFTSPPPSDTSAPLSSPKFCTHCGSPLPPGAKFCPKCGQPVKR